MGGIASKLRNGATTVYVILWDNTLFVLNLVLPKLKKGQVVPDGAAGHHGVWPAFERPGPGDSRSACPMLNAMANHGILPHDGKNIPFSAVNTAIRQTFNFAPTFCFFAPKFAADFMGRPYATGRMDLADLNEHSDRAIEHDASLTRQDTALVADQGAPDQGLVDELLSEATGTMPDGSRRLTTEDLSRALSKRRADARKSNKEYSETTFHNLFGSAKYVPWDPGLCCPRMDLMIDSSSTMLTIFGGAVDDLTPMLKEERFSDKWEPRVLDRYGLTMAKFNALVLRVEHAIDVKKYT